MNPDNVYTGDFEEQAQQHGLDLTVVTVAQARDLYEADFALIRPDQIVAWRGNETQSANAIFSRILAR